MRKKKEHSCMHQSIFKLSREKNNKWGQRKHTGDEEIEVVILFDLGNSFTIALEMGLALLANLDKDMFYTHGFGLQPNDLKRVGLEGLEVLGSEGDEEDDIVGFLCHGHGEGAVLSSSE